MEHVERLAPGELVYFIEDKYNRDYARLMKNDSVRKNASNANQGLLLREDQDTLENELVLNAENADFNGIAVLRQIRRDMDEALIETEVTIEDAKLFLASRNIKFPEP